MDAYKAKETPESEMTVDEKLAVVVAVFGFFFVACIL